jgi:phosphonate metabolism-associated iron-containing alcohol dehydrogenase
MSPDFCNAAAWTYHNPVVVHFGTEAVTGAIAKLPYRRILMLTTPGMVARGTAQRLTARLGETAVHLCARVQPNPELAFLEELAGELRAAPFDAIIALGGGSVIDTAKVLSVLCAAPANFSLEGHFLRGEPLPTGPFKPVIALPTTSGTGSEVTPFATVWDSSSGKKYSVLDPRLFPAMALLDPVWTHDLPWAVTLSTGLDALCQSLESVWNRNANPITLRFALRGARLAWQVLHQGQAILQSPLLRAQLMEASLLAGLAISQTRTALCHSISYPITARYGVPHGLACGFVMPAVLEFNLPADDGRLAGLARELDCATGIALVAEIERLLAKLHVAEILRGYLASPLLLAEHAGEMITKGRSDNNLRSAQAKDVRQLLGAFLPRFFKAT